MAMRHPGKPYVQIALIASLGLSVVAFIRMVYLASVAKNKPDPPQEGAVAGEDSMQNVPLAQLAQTVAAHRGSIAGPAPVFKPAPGIREAPSRGNAVPGGVPPEMEQFYTTGQVAWHHDKDWSLEALQERRRAVQVWKKANKGGAAAARVAFSVLQAGADDTGQLAGGKSEGNGGKTGDGKQPSEQPAEEVGQVLRWGFGRLWRSIKEEDNFQSAPVSTVYSVTACAARCTLRAASCVIGSSVAMSRVGTGTRPTSCRHSALPRCCSRQRMPPPSALWPTLPSVRENSLTVDAMCVPTPNRCQRLFPRCGLQASVLADKAKLRVFGRQHAHVSRADPAMVDPASRGWLRGFSVSVQPGCCHSVMHRQRSGGKHDHEHRRAQ